MKRALKNKWVSALRSGEYDQCQAQLIRSGSIEDRYCCLGVLADIYNPNAWCGSEWEFESDEGVRAEYDKEFGADALNELGLKEKDQTYLIKMNDDDGASFSQIADWVEESILTED